MLQERIPVPGAEAPIRTGSLIPGLKPGPISETKAKTKTVANFRQVLRRMRFKAFDTLYIGREAAFVPGA
jgi:hypothetical protein